MKIRHGWVVCVPLLLAGCGLFDGLFGARRAEQGYTSVTDFPGLADQSIAIVVYAPRATLDEFPGTREEISDFLIAKMREHMPNARLLARQEVINFQDDTLNWSSLPERDIGHHFSVQKVLMVQVLAYSTRRLPGYGDMQGHLRAEVHVTDCSGEAIAGPEWRGIVDVKWPPDRPLNPNQTLESAVRLRLLESFSDRLVRCFYAGGPPGPAIPG